MIYKLLPSHESKHVSGRVVDTSASAEPQKTGSQKSSGHDHLIDASNNQGSQVNMVLNGVDVSQALKKVLEKVNLDSEDYGSPDYEEDLVPKGAFIPQGSKLRFSKTVPAGRGVRYHTPINFDVMSFAEDGHDFLCLINVGSREKPVWQKQGIGGLQAPVRAESYWFVSRKNGDMDVLFELSPSQ